MSKLHAAHRDGNRGIEDGEGFESREQEASAVLHEAQEEINRVQSHYENELVLAKKERVELAAKIQELVAQNERIKVESTRQLSSYKTKYTEYKTKLRKANQNIQTLLARLAKFDIAIQAEREDKADGGQAQPGPVPHYGGMQEYGNQDANMNYALAQAVGGQAPGNLNLNDVIA